jgi:hypothetical protein
MKYADKMFKTWVESSYDNLEENIVEILKEAFDAGMAAGVVFVKQSAELAADLFLDEYQGFETQ